MRFLLFPRKATNSEGGLFDGLSETCKRWAEGVPCAAGLRFVVAPLIK